MCLARGADFTKMRENGANSPYSCSSIHLLAQLIMNSTKEAFFSINIAERFTMFCCFLDWRVGGGWGIFCFAFAFIISVKL